MDVFNKILFQIHRFVGISAGTLLMMVGVTGAILSFSDEITDALNPGVIEVMRQAGPELDAPQLIARLQAGMPDRPILGLTLTGDPADSAQVHSARVNFAPLSGERRGELRYADPYNGQLLPSLRAQPFFKWIEFLHRFLLLPTPIGKVIMGCTAMCLLFLALSGLYLRWPRHALQWRAWFRLDFSLQGRSFLWHLHSTIGTWALAMYLISASTGVYWSFDWVKKGVDGILGPAQTQIRPAANAKKPDAGAATEKTAAEIAGNSAENSAENSTEKPKPAKREAMPAEQIERVWQAFTATVPAYRKVLLRFPERPGESVQVSYLDRDAPHEQALGRMRIDPVTGAIADHRRYNDKTSGERLLSSVYGLHMGSLFGLPGRILMTLAALCLPLFGITGWMLYLDQRRRKSAVARVRRSLAAGVATGGSRQATQ